MCLFIMHCSTPERVIIFFGIPLVNFLSPESLWLDKSDVVTQRQKQSSKNSQIKVFIVYFGFRAIQNRFFLEIFLPWVRPRSLSLAM